jgi:hypothetical protein
VRGLRVGQEARRQDRARPGDLLVVAQQFDVHADAARLAGAAGSNPSPDALMRTFEALSLAQEKPEHPGRLVEAMQPAGFEALTGVTPKPASEAPRGAPAQRREPAARPGAHSRIENKHAERERREREAAEARRRAAEEQERQAELRKRQAAVDRAKEAEARARAAWERAQDALREAEHELAAIRSSEH